MRTCLLNLLLAGLLLVLAPCSRAEGPQKLPIPEQRRAYPWAESQRIKYLNTSLMQQAGAAIRTGDHVAATNALRRVLLNDPGNNHAIMFLAGVSDNLEQWDAARPLYEDIIAHYPEYLDPYLRLGTAALRHHQFATARSAFEELLRRAPSDYPRRQDTIRNLAQVEFMDGRYAAAQIYGEQWLGFEPGLPARTFVLECAIKREDWSGALAQLDALQPLTEAGAARGELLLRRGFVLSRLGQYAEANRALQAAKQLLPDPRRRRDVERQTGFNAMRAGQHSVAADRFKACLLEGCDDELARAYLDALAAGESWTMARIEAERLLNETNLTADTRTALQTTLLAALQHDGLDERLALMAQTLAAETGNARFLLDAAAALERLGRNPEALPLYATYLEQHFDTTVALNYFYQLKRTGAIAEGTAVLEEVLAQQNVPDNQRATAIFELAMLRRHEGDTERYFALMEELMRVRPEGSVLHGYGADLLSAGRYDEAAVVLARSVEAEGDAATRFGICKVLADIALHERRPDVAKSWLERALTFGPADDEWTLSMARIEYQLEAYRSCVDRLLPIADRRASFRLYLGFAFYKLGMPGLALFNLNRAEGQTLSPQEQRNLYANRAYLQFDQEQYAGALEDVDRALAFEADDDLLLVRLKTLVRVGRLREAREAGEALLAQSQDATLRDEIAARVHAIEDPALRAEALAALAQPGTVFQAEVYHALGAAAFQEPDYRPAVDYFTKALNLTGRQSELLYLRGLALYKLGELQRAEEDFVAFYEQAGSSDAVPLNFWGDLGVLEGALGDYDLGTAALAHNTDVFAADVDSNEETAYQYMKWSRRADARAAFKKAIAIYNEVSPYLEGSAAEEYRDQRKAIKQEYTKLGRTWGGQAYLAKTDYDNNNLPVAQSIDGSLPAQAGVSANWRPPKIGFRNERTLDLFGRVLANFEPRSWSLDQDSYQGGVGLVYKPLVKYNYGLSFERLFKIGDNAEDNWLWRNMLAWEFGERPEPGHSVRPTARIYGEVSYFLDDPRRWVYFLDGRLGPTLAVTDKILATVPQVLGTGRYQSNDETGLGTYVMAGIGANLRILEGERRYTTERWYFDTYGHYVWGWFDKQPASLDQRDFEGVIFGLSIVK